MKHICLILLICVFSKPIQAQINLVPNPSFEDTVGCPSNISGQYGDEIYKLQNWFPARNSADFFHACSTNENSVPFNGMGFQNTHSGTGYIGLYSIGNFIPFPNYREYIGVQLLQQLIIGEKYFVTMYVSSAFGGVQGIYSFSNNIGIKLTTSHFEAQSNPLIPDNISNGFFDTIIQDTASWTELKFSFIADSAYNYLYLGNFFDDLHTDSVFAPTTMGGVGAYYYIDDICLSNDSLTCESVTGISDLNDSYNKFIVYPNPVARDLYFKNITTSIYIQLFDSVGREILNGNLNPNHPFIDLNEIVPGVYFIELNHNKKRLIKIIKI